MAYIFYTSWTVYQNTTSVSGKLPSRQEASASERSHPAEPHSLPTEVKDSPSQWVVTYERVVSLPFPPSSLGQSLSFEPRTEPSRLLQDWLRTTHKAFSRTPQALLIRGALSEPLNKGSFDKKWIENLSFNPGDIVNGVYRVSCYEKDQTTSSERVELLIDIPSSYKGPTVRGLILSAIEAAPSVSSDHRGASEENIVFVNETWMWRLVDEKPTMLESSFGQWFHRLLAGWLILKGVSGVTGQKKYL